VKAQSSLAALVALVLPIVLSGCSPTDEPTDAAPSLSLIASVASPKPGLVALSDAAKKEMLARQLRAEREKQIARLEAYAAAGAFALNEDVPGLAFVWRDPKGRLCAMAHLVSASGRQDLVDRVAREKNALQLASLDRGELYDWMLRSGLSVEEIQLVQEPGFLGGKQVDVEWEIARKRDHLRAVVERLRRDTEHSLEITVARLMAHESRATAQAS
jgi:hypothetical protein